MELKMRDGEVELVFEPPFPAPELMSKQPVVIALPDGKRYVADTEMGGNTVFVTRAYRDGAPDVGFGPRGWRAELVDIQGAVPAGMLLRESGGVVIAANNPDQCGLVCFKADGSLDSDFGLNGKIVHSIGIYPDDDKCKPFGIDVDSKRPEGISAALGDIAPGQGGAFYSLMGARFSRENSTLIRCRSDGQLDSEFNGTGIVPVIHPTQSNGGVSITPTSEGGVVVAGTLGTSQTGLRGFFARYNADGSLDINFGENGFAVFDSESAGIPPSNLYQMELSYVTRRSNGDFVASGYLITKEPYSYYGLLICVDSLGRLSASFNNAKPVLFGLLNSALEISFLRGGIAELVDGNIMVGGGVVERSSGLERDMLLVRFRSNGSVDSNYGDRGLLRFKPLDFLVNYIWQLQIDQDGKVLLAGAGGPDNNSSSQRDVVVQIT